jgi:hypothetical protein
MNPWLLLKLIDFCMIKYELKIQWILTAVIFTIFQKIKN